MGQTQLWCNVKLLASGVEDCEFEPWSGQTKEYKIGIHCFKEIEQTLVSSECVGVERSTCIPTDCCFSELALQDTIQHVGHVQSGHPHHHYFNECNLFSP